jgi:hypothetical protein
MHLPHLPVLFPLLPFDPWTRERKVWVTQTLYPTPETEFTKEKLFLM